ncbi:MAG: replicative DNA helicase [Synergistaceae bacterium]|nr:replicative DNA helicase [Synergistaceae bacterium]
MQNNAIIPQNPQAERAVIGACLLSADALGDVSEILKPEDFYDINNKIAYEICVNLYSDNKPVDLVTFQDAAISRGEFERLGGQPFLAELVSDVTVIANAGYHAELVKAAALRRKLLNAGNQIIALAVNAEVDNNSVVDEAEKIILDASGDKDISGPISLKNALPSVVAEVKELQSGARKNTGFRSNLDDLDKIINGFQPGSLNIIAARPSMGKTALALNIAQFGGNDNEDSHILFFSLEMSVKQLQHRMLSAQTLETGTGVKVSDIATGNMSDYDIYAMERASERLQRRNIYICDSSELTAMDFRSKCRRFKTRHHDLSLIVVDYLQLMSSGKKRVDNRQNEVAEISRIIKLTAKELECPIIALSQLSRETERRNEKKPQLSDLRDSGAIEQDADTVILLYREDYYGDNENNDAVNSRADLRIAKNRNGSTGSCRLIFKREFTRFANYVGE